MTKIQPFYVEEGKAIAAMSMLGKICVTAAWQMIIVWENEIYPTTHRCMLVAMNAVIGRVGSVLAPFLLDLVNL